MLAVIGIGVNLLEDDGGTPGALIAGDTVNVGDTFFAEITVEDLRDTPQGVNGLSLELTWDADALEVISAPFDPSDITSPLVTSAFSGFRGGTLDEANLGAMIDDLRGLGPSQSGIGDNGPERYSLIHFRADAVSAESLGIGIGDIGAGLVNYFRNLLADDFQIERPTITVAEGGSEILPPPDDDVPVAELSIGDASIVEGQSGTSLVSLNVRLSEAIVETVTVRVATRDDQATAGDGDYDSFANHVLTFQPGGPSSQSVVIGITGDLQFEPNERFFVELSQPVGATLGDSVGRVVILNDDDPPPAPEVHYTLDLLDTDGDQLERDNAGRYVLAAGESLLAQVYVTDPRESDAAGVFSAFADLVTNSSHVTWDPASLTISDQFFNVQSGVVGNAFRLVDEAGGTAGTTPTGGGERQLLFEVTGLLAEAAPANSVFTISLDAADVAQHETLVYGFGDLARATYENVQVVVGESAVELPPDDTTSRVWQNTSDPLDVNADGLRTPQDVLLIINELNENGPHLLTGDGPRDGQWQLDVNGDGGVSRLDALLIFNYLTFGILPTDQTAIIPASQPDGPQSDGLLDTSIASDTLAVTMEQVDSIRLAAIDQWADAGLNEQAVATLNQVEFSIADLEPGVLARAVPVLDGESYVTIDIDAAGQGWSIDDLPRDDLPRDDGRFDLLTVMSHELGHILGFDHVSDVNQSEDLMFHSLATGQRRLPVPEAVDLLMRM